MGSFKFFFFFSYLNLLRAYKYYKKRCNKNDGNRAKEVNNKNCNNFKRVNVSTFSIYTDKNLISFKKVENQIYKANKWVNRTYSSNINIKIYAQNMQRINGSNESMAWYKISFIRDTILDMNCDIVHLIDVGPKVKEILFPNYKIYENGRDLLAVKNNIKLDVKTIPNWPIFTVNNSDLRFVYVRPNESIKSVVDEVCDLLEKDKCVIGDLNLKSNPRIKKLVAGKTVLGEPTGQTVAIKKKLTARVNLVSAPSDHKGVLIDIKKYLCHNAGVKIVKIDINEAKKIINEILENGKLQTPIVFKTESRMNYGNEEEQFTKDVLYSFLKNDMARCYSSYENWWKKMKKEPFLGNEVPESVEISLKDHYRHDENKKYLNITEEELKKIEITDLVPKNPTFSSAVTNEMIALRDIDLALTTKWQETSDINPETGEMIIKKDIAFKFVANLVKTINANIHNISCKTFFLRKNKNRLELFHDVRIIIIMPIFMKIWESLIYNNVVRYLGNVINKEEKYQYGGVIGGSTYETIFDVQRKYQQGSGKGILFIDIEKGYDSVNWKTLYELINDIEDPSVNACLKIWYKVLIDMDVDVNQNRIKKTRGLGMGLTLAPIMFVYYVHRALLNTKINRHRLAMYVDDLSLILNSVDDENIFQELVSSFKNYEMNINDKKCVVLTTNEDIKRIFSNKMVVKDSDRYLGVQLRITKENTFEVDGRCAYIKKDFLSLPRPASFAVKRLIYHGAILAKLRYSAMMFSIKSMIEKKKVMQMIWSLFRFDFPMLSYVQLTMFSINYIRFFIDLFDLLQIKEQNSNYFDVEDRISKAKDAIRLKCRSGIEQIDSVIAKVEFQISDPKEWEINMETIKLLTDSIFNKIKHKMIEQWKETKIKEGVKVYEKIELFVKTKYVINSKVIQMMLFRHFNIKNITLNVFIIDILIQIGERIAKAESMSKEFNPKYDSFLKDDYINDDLLKMFYNNRLAKVYDTFNVLLEIEDIKEMKEVRREVYKVLCILDTVITCNKRKSKEELFYVFNFKRAMNLEIYSSVAEVIDNQQSKLYEMFSKDKINNNLVTFSVDGSYNVNLVQAGAGVVVKENNKMLKFFFQVPESFKEERNVSGELLATLWAIKKALQMKLKRINLVFDYLGNVLYVKGAWAPKTKMARFFVNEVNNILMNNELEINWLKVTSHTNIDINDIADRLAKLGSGIGEKENDDVEIINPLKN